MKTVLIMRHGNAEAHAKSDETRALTETGQAEAKIMAAWLNEAYAPEALLVSPYLRAQQTAAAVSDLQPNWQFEETCADIIPTGNAELAGDYLKALIETHGELDSWLVVAHMPIVSYLVEQFCPETLPLFHTAAVAVINYDETTGMASLEQLVNP